MSLLYYSIPKLSASIKRERQCDAIHFEFSSDNESYEKIKNLANAVVF